MSLPYFYEENITASPHTLTEETSRHCVQVLRMKTGEQLQLTDGKGNLFTATIIDAHKKHCEVTLDEKKDQEKITSPKPAAAKITVGISLLKNPSRFEWFLEKAAEIGISEIIPLICERTEKQNFRFERMNNILISAMLQSQQTWLCHLHQPERINAVVNKSFDGLKLVAHCDDHIKQDLTAAITKNCPALILIGPEGDFSATEIEAAVENDFISVSLGATRLRSETAGIVAAALLRDKLTCSPPLSF